MNAYKMNAHKDRDVKQNEDGDRMETEGGGTGKACP